VQVDPIKPTLKAPGTERLRLKCDDLVSCFAFNFNLRRYNQAPCSLMQRRHFPPNLNDVVGWCRAKPHACKHGIRILRLGSLTQRSCVKLCNLNTSYGTPGFNALKQNFMTCFQLLLLNSTCAATTWAIRARSACCATPPSTSCVRSP